MQLLRNIFINILYFAFITAKVTLPGQEDMKVLESELAAIQDLSFAFRRAASRMIDMTSSEYYAKWKEMYVRDDKQ